MLSISILHAEENLTSGFLLCRIVNLTCPDCCRTGLGDVIGNAVSSAALPLVVVAFIVAALVRICVGSSTVAMTMAAGIIAAMPEIATLSPLYLACITAAVAGGATVCSHFNDSGFWLVRSLVGLDEKTTLKTWTIMETLVGGTGFLVALLISFFV